jgi:hypothetical protein
MPPGEASEGALRNETNEEGLPPYAFVPRGPWPHPYSSPQGHSYGIGPRAAPPIDEANWNSSALYRRGLELFNQGFYWEAHEAWETLWNAHGRQGATADVLKALIKLAAAGVKVRERQPGGVVTHARRAEGLFQAVRAQVGPRWLGLDLMALASIARTVAQAPPSDPGTPGDRVVRVFDFRIEPGTD